MRFLRLLLILLVAPFGLLAAARADDPACGPYTVSLYAFGQLYYLDADDRPAGVDKDLVEALARRSGCTLRTVVDSRVRIWDQLSRGLLDITTSGIATPERERLAEFWPHFRSRNRAVVKAAHATRWAGMAAFLADRDARVAVVKSFRHGPTIDAFLDRLRAEQRVSEVSTFEGAYRVLLAGRVDLMFAHPLNLPGTPAGGAPAVTMLDWAPQDEVPIGLVVSLSRVTAADRKRLRTALHSLLRDGSVEAILARHIPADWLATVRPADAR